MWSNSTTLKFGLYTKRVSAVIAADTLRYFLEITNRRSFLGLQHPHITLINALLWQRGYIIVRFCIVFKQCVVQYVFVSFVYSLFVSFFV